MTNSQIENQTYCSGCQSTNSNPPQTHCFWLFLILFLITTGQTIYLTSNQQLTKYSNEQPLTSRILALQEVQQLTRQIKNHMDSIQTNFRQLSEIGQILAVGRQRLSEELNTTQHDLHKTTLTLEITQTQKDECLRRIPLNSRMLVNLFKD